MNPTKQLLWPLALLLAACATSGLDPLVLEGPELHTSLATAPPGKLSGSPVSLALQHNPHHSSDADFVEDIALRASQGGAISGQGIRAALLAVYLVEDELLGLYGLEAESTAHAESIEPILRELWAMNASANLARVHRAGAILVVVWAYGESPACWEAVNANVVGRLRY